MQGILGNQGGAASTVNYDEEGQRRGAAAPRPRSPRPPWRCDRSTGSRPGRRSVRWAPPHPEGLAHVATQGGRPNPLTPLGRTKRSSRRHCLASDWSPTVGSQHRWVPPSEGFPETFPPDASPLSRKAEGYGVGLNPQTGVKDSIARQLPLTQVPGK